jgi:predicted transposase YdaD
MDKRDDKPWDDSLRKLVRANPQAFVSWILGEAEFIGELPEKLKSWKLEVDALLRTSVKGHQMLLHIEFQTYNDLEMAERLLRYNVLLRSEYKLPVVSCVIYLLKDGAVPPSQLIWNAPIERDVIHFFFESIELGELSPDDLLTMEQPGLLPLLPLTKGGIRKEVTEQMFTSLKASEQTDLLAIGGTLASLVFSREHSPDLEWLHRRLRAMHDILRESPYYQEILQEGYQEGRQEGREEGKLEGQREALLAIVQFRFPKIARLAKRLVAANDDPAGLQNLTVKISMAQTAEEAKQYMLEAVEENGS